MRGHISMDITLQTTKKLWLYHKFRKNYSYGFITIITKRYKILQLYKGYNSIKSPSKFVLPLTNSYLTLHFYTLEFFPSLHYTLTSSSTSTTIIRLPP